MKIPRQLIELGCLERPLVLEDFEECCRLERIWVYRKRLRYDEGIFFYYKDQAVIVINKTLSGGLLLWTAFHELIHYFLHPPELQYFTKGTEDKVNYEANIITSVVLIPKYLIETKTFGELQDEYDFPAELLWIRKEAYERYKL